MFERYDTGEKAVLVHIYFSDIANHNDLDEFELLVKSAGLSQQAVVTSKRKVPQKKYFVGTGKAEEIATLVKEVQADVVIFNHVLSPAQERDLEALCQCRVFDRTTLILDIFAQRARTHEGKLQVELAQLKHLSTRLVRGWTHLERQKGGIGLRGPGEKQLETDKRLLNERVKAISKRLNKVAKQREQTRRSRLRSALPTVALVGYTNAGKSTLFNQLTKADVYAADQLFATLDPTMRRLSLASSQECVLADTVGFVQNLPHDLVAAFKATLVEVQEAQLLLHVVDCSDEHMHENMTTVDNVLQQLDANSIPQLVIYNKIDLLEGMESRIDYDESGFPERVWISAHQKSALDLIQQAIFEKLAVQVYNITFRLPVDRGDYLGLLFEYSEVLEQNYDDQGRCLITVSMPQKNWRQLLKNTHQELEDFIYSSDIIN